VDKFFIEPLLLLGTDNYIFYFKRHVIIINLIVSNNLE